MLPKSALYRFTKDTSFIIGGILSAGMGIKGFLLSSHFIDGGVTGISMLLASLFHIPLLFGYYSLICPLLG